ncbi:MAG: hypothetical protein EHM20_05550 [Alphaproteobacteria bacterium]|nr:MAG: hypothetical protein EHM20_05550 [Alphaproteobacteria bacterium]
MSSSSKYRYYILGRKYDFNNDRPLADVVTENNFLKILQNYPQITEQSKYKIHQQISGVQEPYIILSHKYTIDCRETLIYRLVDAFLLINAMYINHNKYVCFVEYTEESSGIIEEDHKELMLKFSAKFLDSSYLSIKKIENRIFLFLNKTSDQPRKSVLLMSLILYIMRSKKIMSVLLEETEDEQTLSSLMRLLSVKFLRDWSLGDVYNSNLALSMFCYYYLNESFEHFICNGPESAAMAITSPYNLIEYINNVFIKVFPGAMSLSQLRDRLILDNLHQNFIKGFNKILYYMGCEKQKG